MHEVLEVRLLLRVLGAVLPERHGHVVQVHSWVSVALGVHLPHSLPRPILLCQCDLEEVRELRLE